MEHGFSWFGITPLADIMASHVFHALLALAILCLIGWRIRTNVKKSPDPLVPDTCLTARNVFEIVVEGIYGQLRSVIGPEEGPKYVTIVGSLFLYIFFCNILGIIPGFEAATGNINTNLAMAVIIFLLYNYYGIKEHGIGYIKQFTGPILWLAPLMVCIEVLSHLFRPLSLSIRLFGNMFGDHMVLGIFSDLVPVLVPVIFLMIGMLVSLIQAFVFAVLAAVYLALAISHDH
jgi:F-type H+-transporting ATPase subunit a